MLKFLKSLLGPASDNQVYLAKGEVPSWLTEQEKKAHTTLYNEVEEPIRNIRNAMARFQLTVNSLKDADQNPETHPRIKSIAKNSLPLFLRAMNTSLAKEMPDDPEAFYAAAVECVKGCLNAVRGQGRYLMVAFPEEMKDIKAGVDAIGHEINVMTRAISRFKEESSHIETARSAFMALSDAEKDRERSFAREARIRERINGNTARLESIAAEIARLSVDESFLALDAGRNRCADLTREHDDLLRHYASLTMTASHVFRKAEKIAIRRNLSKEVHILKEAMDVLSHHEVSSAESVARILNAACPVVQTMIDDGDIILKNREERVIFSDTAQFSGEVYGLCTKYRETGERYRKEEETLLSHPVPARLRSLEREKEQLESMCSHEEQETRDLLNARKELEAAIPLLRDELAKKLGEMRGETVQLQPDEPVGG
ncbi:hypothetical protein [Methanoregula sp.]|jgi:hypothetical protein|uniref:hypothetical protein n=1 Tax=Methanoregula sp. TaxID=2052170 RepID=UPI003C72A131